jgi:hypothetical protein
MQPDRLAKRPSRLAAAGLATVMLAAGADAAVAQDATPRDWRRTDMSADTLGATAVGEEVEGVRRVTVVIHAPVDRHPIGEKPYRSIVFETNVKCGRGIWAVTSVTYYASDLSVAEVHGPVPEAPLVRETPLHAAITDACDGGYENGVGLTTSDALDVVRWLGKSSPSDAN